MEVRSNGRTYIINFVSAFFLLVLIHTIPLSALENGAKQHIAEELPKALIPVAAEASGKADSSYHITTKEGEYNTVTAPHGLHTEFSSLRSNLH